MKRILAILSLAVLLSAFTGVDDVVSALKSGNASLVAKSFDNTVEIGLPDKSNSYSKSQGEMVLRDFFSTNGVKGFEVLHRGENAGSQYCIGTLSTKNGTFRTTFFMKQRGDNQVLQELRFEQR